MTTFNRPQPWKRLNGEYTGKLSNVDGRFYKRKAQVHVSFRLEGINSGVNEYLTFDKFEHQLVLGELLDMGQVCAGPTRKELAAIVEEIKRVSSNKIFKIKVKYNDKSGFNEIIFIREAE